MQALNPEFPNMTTFSQENLEREMNVGNWNILVPTGRENKLMMPLIAASEKGRGQTESLLEREREMWWASTPKFLNQSSLERDALESESLVDEKNKELLKRVVSPGLEARIWQN